MDVRDLTRDQLYELKQSMICKRNDEQGEGTTWGELASADDLISDAEVFEEFGGVIFDDDDFDCTANIPCSDMRFEHLRIGRMPSANRFAAARARTI